MPEKASRPLFRALHHRNFRLFFGGQGLSLVGTWMQIVAMSWLVYRITASPFYLGLIGFSSQICSFFISPFAGVLSDRWNRHRLLIATQSLSMIQALILAFLTFTHSVTFSYLLLLSFFLGIVNAFDMPARQAFIVEMIENREDLSNAIALNSFLFNGARLVGPSIAGILISIVGEGGCFLSNAISFLAVIMALSAMRLPPRDGKEEPWGRALTKLKEGFVYGFGFAPIWSILVFVGWISLVATVYTTLMPVFAKTVLHGGAHDYGFLMGATGVGAMIAALFLASRSSVLGLGKLIAIGSLTFGMGLLGFSLSRIFWFSLVTLAVAGFGMMVHLASSNTILQTIVDDDKRGRIMSLYAMAFMGMSPIGSLSGGSLASRIGAPLTVLLMGSTCIVAALLFMWKLPSLRRLVLPIYSEKGIVREKPEAPPPGPGR